MCLAEFAANYTYSLGSSEEHENEFVQEYDLDIPDDASDTADTNVIKLQNGLGHMRKRKRKAVIRWHNFNIEKERKKPLQITHHAIPTMEDRRRLHVIR